jgi:translation elongation factor EF-1beta
MEISLIQTKNNLHHLKEKLKEKIIQKEYLHYCKLKEPISIKLKILKKIVFLRNSQDKGKKYMWKHLKKLQKNSKNKYIQGNST